MNKFIKATSASLALLMSSACATVGGGANIDVDSEGRNIEVWNIGIDQYFPELLAGRVVCEGNSRHYACSQLAYGGRMLNTTVVAREGGLTQNLNALVTFYLDESYNFRIDPTTGRPITVIGHVAGSPNSALVWNQGLAQIPGALVNGMGAAALNAAFPQCGGDGCGGSTFVVQGGMAFSQAEADAAVAANLANQLTSGGCGSGGCPTPGSRAGMVNPSNDGIE